MWPFNKDKDKEKPTAEESEIRSSESYFGKYESSASSLSPYKKMMDLIEDKNKKIIEGANVGMDSQDASALKLSLSRPESISSALADWFSSQFFIGYQMAAVLAQNWLINRACTMPGRDATRNGYDIVSTDGTEIPDSTIKTLQKYDKKYRLRYNCEQFVRMGRIFGVRIALFDIESTQADFYELPFNIDSVDKGSYKGIIQIDPYWCVPELVSDELRNPASQNFYDPTYWVVNGKRYHRSHLFVFRNAEVPDILKPMYLYGGIPVPQLIMERVYGAERTASESIGLVMSKRTSVWLTNMDAFMSDADTNSSKLSQWVNYRDNYGIKVGSKDGDEFQQHDTSLGDLDDVIMTNYQLVSAAAGVPATKLLGTTPKGFSSTGEGEAKNYHEELESIQEHDLTELVERHHQLIMKSFCDEVIETSVNWRPVDSPTAKELAERNKTKADTYSALVMAGAVDGSDVRYRLASDPDSGFHDMGEKDSTLEDLGFTPEQMEAAQELGFENEE